ncbi:NAD(P)/FAD-dependent oxidoreductase [Baekduia soli]|uniref:NAD(P)/FAD-dependent oxidoreductase n=2 Tax=Baekduia soli TaxID=496014 RepID=A0A5B8UBS3_9ACTN|nr:NAD(P)/FAD-dependent oxidoreductase [Baekduia soli]
MKLKRRPIAEKYAAAIEALYDTGGPGDDGRPSREGLRAVLDEADIPVLLMVLVHLTGDRRWMQAPYLPERDMRIIPDPSGGLAPERQDEVRAAALEVLAAARPHDALPDVSEEQFAEMLRVCVADDVPQEYVPMLLEDMGFRARPRPEPVHVQPGTFSVLVIGAGFSGIATSIALAEAGIPHTIVERNDDVGGCWLENTYPEAGVDTPNHWYSFSFAREHDWRHYFSKQPEILDYVRGVADAHGVRERVRFGTTVTACRYDDATQRWHTEVMRPDGTPETLVSHAVVTGVGAFHEPKIPAFDGLERFGGPVFHTSRWPAGLDLRGRRVALVGTGASCVQAARTVAEDAEHLTIFQRSPQWLSPNPYYRAEVGEGKRWLLRNVPLYASWYRFTLFWRYGDSLLPHIQVDPEWEHPERAVNASNDRHRRFFTRYIERELEGRPDLIAKALPSYPPYGKRMIIDNDWYRTIRRDDVTLVDRAVAGLDETGIIDADGRHHEVDVVAMATGFHATRFLWPMEITGAGGLTIDEAWDGDDARAHLGITMPGFPNLFMTLGPNTLLGHGGSAAFVIEAQVNYIVRCLAWMAREQIGSIEPRQAPFEAYNAAVDAAHERMVFAHPGMDNWYKNSRGRVAALTPFRLVDYWSMTREPDPEDFDARPRTAPPAPVAP